VTVTCCPVETVWLIPSGSPAVGRVGMTGTATGSVLTRAFTIQLLKIVTYGPGSPY